MFCFEGWNVESVLIYLLNLFSPLWILFLIWNIKAMTSKKLEAFLMKIVLFISHYFSKKLTCVPWTQRFEKHFKFIKVNIKELLWIHTSADNWSINIGDGSNISLKIIQSLTLQVSVPQNGQTHSNNLSEKANELFECVWPFCGVGV